MSLAEFAGDTPQQSDDLPTMPREVMEGEEDFRYERGGGHPRATTPHPTASAGRRKATERVGARRGPRLQSRDRSRDFSARRAAN